jgi:DNA-binding MarR family transcriptional regulator
MLHVLGSEGGAVIGAVDETGLNFAQMKVLFTIAGAEAEGDALSVKSLAEQLGVSVPTASRAVDGLCKRKLVTRAEDAADRRIKRVSLTATGRRVADTVTAARLRGLERFAAGLDAAERRKLDAALEVLLERPELAALYRSNSKRARR